MFIFLIFLVVSNILKFRVFKLICLSIKIIYAAILSGLIAMRIVLEKKGKNVVLGNTVFLYRSFSSDFSLSVTCMAQLIRETKNHLFFTGREFHCNF